MTTQTELAKKIFRRTLGGSTTPALFNTGGEGQGSQSTDIRYGTAVAINEDTSTIDVELDITGVVVSADTGGLTFNIGDRVALIWQGNKWVIVSNEAVGNAFKDVQEETAKEIKIAGDKIREDVQADLDAVDEAFNNFKNTHKLTDADIKKKIEEDGQGWKASITGEINTKLEQYVTSTSLDLTLSGFRTSVSETYQSKTDAGTMKLDLQSKIDQTSTAIATEVSDRKTAISGATQTLESKITQLSGSITQKVSDEVRTQTGDITSRVTTVETTASGLQTTVSEHSSTVGNIDSRFTFTTSGLTIKSSATGNYSTQITSSGFYVKNSSTNLAGITSNYAMFHAGTAGTTGYYGILATNTGLDTTYESIVAGKVLWGNASGFNGNITGLANLLNYRVLEFVYGDYDYRMATKRVYVKQIVDRYVTLERLIRSTDSVANMYIDTACYTISSNSITRDSLKSGRLIIQSNNTCVTSSDCEIKLYYIIGWR